VVLVYLMFFRNESGYGTQLPTVRLIATPPDWLTRYGANLLGFSQLFNSFSLPATYAPFTSKLTDLHDFLRNHIVSFNGVANMILGCTTTGDISSMAITYNAFSSAMTVFMNAVSTSPKTIDSATMSSISLLYANYSALNAQYMNMYNTFVSQGNTLPAPPAMPPAMPPAGQPPVISTSYTSAPQPPMPSPSRSGP